MVGAATAQGNLCDLSGVGRVGSVLALPVGDRGAMPPEAEAVLIEREGTGEARVADGHGIGRVDGRVELLARGPEAAVDARCWHQVVDRRLHFRGRWTHTRRIP